MITIYLTNHSFDRVITGFKKLVTIHYYEDCILLNADYITEKEERLNSGVKIMDIDSLKDFREFLAMVNCKCRPCTQCELRNLIEWENELNNNPDAII